MQMHRNPIESLGFEWILGLKLFYLLFKILFLLQFILEVATILIVIFIQCHLALIDPIRFLFWSLHLRLIAKRNIADLLHLILCFSFNCFDSAFHLKCMNRKIALDWTDLLLFSLLILLSSLSILSYFCFVFLSGFNWWWEERIWVTSFERAVSVSC